MAKIDKSAKWNEFTIKDGKHCIGGQEIFRVNKSISGWIWYQTQKPKVNPTPQDILYGYVEGMASEWGSWYADDMESSDIIEVPKESWNNIESLALA